MKMTETKNYTPELLDKIISMYEELGNDGLEEIATSVGKSPRSIRSKLVREGKYQATIKGAVAKPEGPSKKELLRELSKKVPDLTEEELKGFEGATKIALTRLLGLVAH